MAHSVVVVVRGILKEAVLRKLKKIIVSAKRYLSRSGNA